MLQPSFAFLQENGANPTFSIKTLIPAVVTFALGLLAKFAYDLWKERRKRKTVVITKTVLSSFSPNSLDDDIRKAVEVNFQGRVINTIQLVRVEIENTSANAVKKQALTVRFSDQAQIIGTPKTTGSSEDFRYVKADDSAPKPNTQRFIVDLLQKGRSLAWDFAVINHQEADFVVEHGVATAEAKDVDLDVLPTITTEKAQVNLAGRIQRAVRLLIYILIAYFLKDILPRTIFGPLVALAAPLFTIAIIWLLLTLMREAMLIIPTVVAGWSAATTDSITIDTGSGSNVVVAPHGSASLRNIVPVKEAVETNVTSSDPQISANSGESKIKLQDD